MGQTKTTQNVIWGSILTPSQKKSSKKLKMRFGQNEVKSKMGVQGVFLKKSGKMGQNAIWVFGRITEIYLEGTRQPEFESAK